MKSFDSRVYSINDFVEWDKQNTLRLNPTFQRRAVWSEKAKSYLMDTILRGKPIPKVFVRQQINVTTKSSLREVVDGQQRLRTILSYIKDGFSVSKRHNPEHGGKRFSQLEADIQSQVLSYEVAVDLLINLPDSEVLDIFGRLNSYAVVLNEQEKINATHFGQFKILADEIGRKYNEYWLAQKILTPQQILRMSEVSLVADLLVALREGIKSKKQIKRFYAVYEENYEEEPVSAGDKFDNTVSKIGLLYPEGLSTTEFKRPVLFYSLFTSVAHCLFGISGINQARLPLQTDRDIEVARNGLDRVGELFNKEDAANLSDSERQFLEDTGRHSTDEPVRKRRTEYLLGLMG